MFYFDDYFMELRKRHAIVQVKVINDANGNEIERFELPSLPLPISHISEGTGITEYYLEQIGTGKTYTNSRFMYECIMPWALIRIADYFNVPVQSFIDAIRNDIEANSGR